MKGTSFRILLPLEAPEIALEPAHPTPMIEALARDQAVAGA